MKIYGELGVVKTNPQGLLQCHICGGFFDLVAGHARQKHLVSALDYKKRFGLDITKGLTSEDSKQISRNRVMENYDKCIGNNLVKNGVSTRYENGSKGRTKDKVSKQTYIRLVEHITAINKSK